MLDIFWIFWIFNELLTLFDKSFDGGFLKIGHFQEVIVEFPKIGWVFSYQRHFLTVFLSMVYSNIPWNVEPFTIIHYFVTFRNIPRIIHSESLILSSLKLLYSSTKIAQIVGDFQNDLAHLQPDKRKNIEKSICDLFLFPFAICF